MEFRHLLELLTNRSIILRFWIVANNGWVSPNQFTDPAKTNCMFLLGIDNQLALFGGP
jgi:hypothetical protein